MADINTHKELGEALIAVARASKQLADAVHAAEHARDVMQALHPAPAPGVGEARVSPLREVER